jgi:hypothetical protein
MSTTSLFSAGSSPASNFLRRRRSHQRVVCAAAERARARLQGKMSMLCLLTTVYIK